MPFEIVRGDIIKAGTDIIVNPANKALAAGGGVCGLIFSNAGYYQLQQECDKLNGCPTGQAKYTNGFNLCKYIIHAVGPIYRDGRHNERELLESAYLNSLKLASKLEVESIAFPLISAGIYHYPKNEAFEVAVNTISNYVKENELLVKLVIHGNDSYGDFNSDIDEYISRKMPRLAENSRPEPTKKRSLLLSGLVEKAKNVFVESEACEESIDEEYSSGYFCESSIQAEPLMAVDLCEGIDEYLKHIDESFSESLFKIIDSKGLSDPDVYKRANIDRKHFSKMRSTEYRPSKNTVLALSIALKLTLSETESLLQKAGFALSNSSISDLIIRYYIERGNYDIYQINADLFKYDQRCLGV